MKNYLPLLLILFLLFPHSYATTIPIEFQKKTDRLFNGTEKKTFVEIIKSDTSVVYYAATFKTMPFDINTIKKNLIQISNYEKAFDFIEKSFIIGNRSTYLMVAKVGPVKSWFLADFDSSSHNNIVTYRGIKNKDKDLNQKIRIQEDGAFVIEFDEFNIFWMLKDLKNGSSRVSLVATTDPSVWVPKWLFKLISKIIFPSMIKDFEKFIEKNNLQ